MNGQGGKGQLRAQQGADHVQLVSYAETEAETDRDGDLQPTGRMRQKLPNCPGAAQSASASAPALMPTNFMHEAKTETQGNHFLQLATGRC